jgi:hypothetical protein
MSRNGGNNKGEVKRSKEAVTKFNRHIAAMRRMILHWIGNDNYAGVSSQGQLDRIQEKFWDCVYPQD